MLFFIDMRTTFWVLSRVLLRKRAVLLQFYFSLEVHHVGRAGLRAPDKPNCDTHRRSSAVGGL